MAVLGLILVLAVQIISSTATTISSSNKQLDSSAVSRVVLDRFGNDFAGAFLRGGATAVYYSEPGNAGNSAIAFVTSSRARGPISQTNPWTTDTRSAFVGYRVRGIAQYIGNSSTPVIPCLNRGDGRYTFSTADLSDINNNATENLWDLFGTGNARIPNDLVATTPNDENVLKWELIAAGVFRFHISFVLSDGRIVQDPPAYNNFFCNQGMGSTGCNPLAFSKQSSSAANKAYVTGLIVGVAILDQATQNLAYAVDNNFWTTVGNKISRPTADGETPVQVWSQKLATLTSNDPNNSNYLFPPVRQNLRFYQRFYNVNL